MTIRSIDRRSGRGKEQYEAQEREAALQSHMAAVQREAAMGPAIQLTFPSDQHYQIWRDGIVIEGRQSLAGFLMRRLREKPKSEYDALVVQLGTILAGPVPNMLGAENVLREFLGLPRATDDGAGRPEEAPAAPETPEPYAGEGEGTHDAPEGAEGP